MKAGNRRGERQAASRCFLETVLFGAEWTWKLHRQDGNALKSTLKRTFVLLNHTCDCDKHQLIVLSGVPRSVETVWQPAVTRRSHRDSKTTAVVMVVGVWKHSHDFIYLLSHNEARRRSRFKRSILIKLKHKEIKAVQHFTCVSPAGSARSETDRKILFSILMWVSFQERWTVEAPQNTMSSSHTFYSQFFYILKPENCQLAASLRNVQCWFFSPRSSEGPELMSVCLLRTTDYWRQPASSFKSRMEVVPCMKGEEFISRCFVFVNNVWLNKQVEGHSK